MYKFLFIIFYLFFYLLKFNKFDVTSNQLFEHMPPNQFFCFAFEKVWLQGSVWLASHFVLIFATDTRVLDLYQLLT